MMLSPCIKKCKLKDNKCQGCGRTLEQIRDWIKYPIEKQAQIIKELH